MFYIFLFFMIFLVIAALIAVHTDNLLSSVICLGAIGFGGSLLFLFLRAPDIAIPQVVVEVLGLIILIRATISRDKTLISGQREFFGIVASVAILFAISAVGLKAFAQDMGEAGTVATITGTGFGRRKLVSGYLGVHSFQPRRQFFE